MSFLKHRDTKRQPQPQDRPSPFSSPSQLQTTWSPEDQYQLEPPTHFESIDSVHTSRDLQNGVRSPVQHQWRPTPSPQSFLNDNSSSFRPVSSYGFKPIPANSPRGISPQLRFSPSPMLLQGKESPSYSAMTSDTEMLTLDSSSCYSQASFRSLTPSSSSYCRTVTPTERSSFGNHQSSAHNNVSPNPKGRSSPFKNDDDDEVRKTRIKTEMCMHYESGRPCPFGATCTYAHGEEELQMTKLIDLNKAGLIDIETYRTKPCLTWVTTGSCPFGKRCTHIHDPRVGGAHSSWLPVTETQGNTTSTDINVEALLQKRTMATLFSNPFGRHFCLESDSWSDLYKLVCHVNYSRKGGRNDVRKRPPLDHAVKLQIALKMRGDSNWQYKFRPQHLIHDELCMVLQQRCFSVNEDAIVSEISQDRFNSERPDHVMAHELAFGPDEDSSVRTISLWFNIDATNVATCTPQQAKRFRWKKGIKKSKESSHHPAKKSAFEKLDSFPMIRPYEQEAYDFSTRLLRHRLNVVLSERIRNMRERHLRLQELEAEKKSLHKQFTNIQQNWKLWEWPINKGRSVVTRRTPVPSVDGNYKFDDKADPAVIRHTGRIWKSFVGTDFDDITGENNDKSVHEQAGNIRLKVLVELANGNPVSGNRTLPRIAPFKKGLIKTDLQDRCWRALMLRRGEENEWDLVEEHFKQSRSKKVLSIIQEKSPA